MTLDFRIAPCKLCKSPVDLFYIDRWLNKYECKCGAYFNRAKIDCYLENNPEMTFFDALPTLGMTYYK